MNDLLRVSKTQISMFAEDCSMRWYFRYQLGIKTPPSGALKLGGSFHQTAAHNYKQKAVSHADLPLDEQTDFFAQTFEDEVKKEEVVWDEGETAAQVKDVGVGLVKAHHQKIAPTVEPKSAENVEQTLAHLILQRVGEDKPKMYPLPAANYFRTGDAAREIVSQQDVQWAYVVDSIIDLIDSKDIIRENKTAGRTPNQDDADSLLDLTHYALAYRLHTKQVEGGVAMDVAVKTKTPAALSLTSQRSREQLRAHLNRIGMMAKAVQQEIFLPHTQWFGCRPKWCGYWDMCPYGGKSRLIIDVKAKGNANAETSKRLETPAVQGGSETTLSTGQIDAADSASLPNRSK